MIDMISNLKVIMGYEKGGIKMVLRSDYQTKYTICIDYKQNCKYIWYTYYIPNVYHITIRKLHDAETKKKEKSVAHELNTINGKTKEGI